MDEHMWQSILIVFILILAVVFLTRRAKTSIKDVSQVGSEDCSACAQPEVSDAADEEKYRK